MSNTSATPPPRQPAAVTVVLATCNRADSLAATLGHLAEQQVEAGTDWRVIAVDNASTDDTPQVLAHWKNDSRVALEVLHERRPGKSRALNHALDYIESGLVVFIDDDVELEPDWLKAYVGAQARWPSHAIFGGPIRPVFPADTPNWVRDERYVRQSPMFARYAPREDEGTTSDIPLGPNMAIRRSAIGDTRFDVRLGPGGDAGVMGCETEFEMRLASAGHAPFVYVPKARARHRVRYEQMTVDAVWKRAYVWGRSMPLIEGRSERGPFVDGAPLRYWFGALRAFLRFAPFCLGPRHFRLKYGWQWQVRAGRLRGYRDYERQQRSRQPAQRGSR